MESHIKIKEWGMLSTVYYKKQTVTVHCSFRQINTVSINISSASFILDSLIKLHATFPAGLITGWLHLMKNKYQKIKEHFLKQNMQEGLTNGIPGFVYFEHCEA